MNLEYKLNLFEPQIETNTQFMTLEVIRASSEVARKAWKTHCPNAGESIVVFWLLWHILSLVEI